MLQATFLKDPELALAQYRETGVHVEPGVLDRSLCEELVRVASGFPGVLAGDYRTVLQPHRQSEAFLRALRFPSVKRILNQILGGKISGVQTQFFYGKPGTPGFQPHQDNRFVNAPRGKFVSTWVALADVSKDNGGLYFYPGTFREPLLDVQEVDAEETMLQDANALRLRCLIPERYKPVDVTLPKGGAVFFDGHTVHGSHPNRSNKDRYALLMTYVARGAPFVAGRYAQREEVFID